MDLNHRWGNKSVHAVVTYSPNPFLRCDLQSKSDHTAVDLLPDLSPALNCDRHWIAAEHPDAVPFVSWIVKFPAAYDYDAPCPH